MPSESDSAGPPSPRTRVRREPHRGVYDRASIDEVLDAGLVCHLAFLDGASAVRRADAVRPGRGRRVRARVGGQPRGANDGRRAGLPDRHPDRRTRAGPERLRALGELPQRRAPRLDDRRRGSGREADRARGVHREAGAGPVGRGPSTSSQELVATSVLALPIEEVSAKIRTGPPEDGDGPDAALPIWAGTIPTHTTWGGPVPDPALRRDIPVPVSVHRLLAGAREHHRRQ